MATDDQANVPQRVIYAKEIIGLGTQFGPYPGKDAKERKFSEWMAFVCKAKTRNEANLISFVSDSQKYFRSCKIIHPFDTFIVWDEENEDSNMQSIVHVNVNQLTDVNGGAPQRMKLRNKKSNANSPDVAKVDSSGSVRNAKEIKTDFILTDEDISEKSGYITDNSINLDCMETEKSLVTCTECGEGFVSHAGFALHKLLHGQERHCITCGDQFTTNKNLHQHLLSHTSEKFTTCNQCFRFFDKEFDWNLKEHKHFKAPLCNECESYVIINRDITIAKEISGELTCNYCGRVYYSRKSLNIHLDKHNSKYCCRKCGKVFGTYNAITRHILVHTNFKPLKCEVCGMRFTNLLKHQIHGKLCGKRSKRKESVLLNTPVNCATVKNEKLVNEFSVIVNNSLPSKLHNTRSSSRSKPGSLTIGNEKTVALDCDLVDNASLNSSSFKGAEFFHCQLENNNILSDDNINFPFTSEQASASQQRIEELNSHRPSSRCNEDVAAQQTYSPRHIESSTLDVHHVTNFVVKIEDIDDSSQSTNNENTCENIYSTVQKEGPFKVNGNNFHDCSVKIMSLYDCPKCYKVYASSEGLAMHTLTHFYGQKCTKCSNNFAKHQRLKTHLIGHSSELIKNCFKCQMLFGIPFSYDQNYTSRHNTERLLCEECDKATRIETSECVSLLELKQNGLFECQCDETSKTMNIFQDPHMNEFLCAECGQCFPSWEELKEHLCLYMACKIRKDISRNECSAAVIEELSEIQTSSTSISNPEQISNNDINDNSYVLSAESLPENENATFYFECSDCKRNFQTEAATSLHMLLHSGQSCMLCGDQIEQYFDFKNNDLPQNVLLSSRSASDNVIGTNNLPPITFHPVHGENIRLLQGGAVARRSESFCKGVAFSNRPVKINERVYLRFSETSTSWSGVIRFGFTNVDPSSLRGNLPKYVCPDFTNKPGCWAKALAERYAERDTVLFYYVTQNGDVHFGINGEEKGIFFNGVDTRGPLWAVLDIYGNTIAMEFLETRTQLNNFTRPQRSEAVTSVSDGAISDSILRVYDSVLFHTLHGRNINLSNDRTVATRLETEFSQGYIMQTESMYVGSLAFGLTSCNPSILSSTDLPEDSDLLLDRPEYWVVNKDVANCPQRGDQLGFSISLDGEVIFYKNDLAPVTIMHVDHTQQLWPFFDVYANTTTIRLLGILCPENSHQRGQLQVILPPMSCSNSQNTQRKRSEEKAGHAQEVVAGSDGIQDNAQNECTICYERAVDCALYTCGHMCMCYDCAKQLWQRPNGAQCPICRADIKDVIRTYRS
uniref:RING-type E3 ubiquitin transferase n=1 Tax=Strigamia maritima TaxID=126957 RepID=T1JH57_STRMM